MQVLKNIQKNLEDILKDHSNIEQDYIHVIHRVPGSLMNLTTQMIEVMDKLDHATMSIDKFRNKVIFRSNHQYMEQMQAANLNDQSNISLDHQPPANNINTNNQDNHTFER